MTAAITLLGLLVVLPALAWWLGGRRFWGRLQPGRGADPWGDFVRRHRLSATEQFRVQRAVGRGEALEGDRLRAAAVDLAQETRAQLAGPLSGGSRAQRVVQLLAVLWLVLVVAQVVFAVTRGGWSDVPWFGLLPAVVGAAALSVQRRNLRRAIELNRAPEASGSCQRE